MFGVSCAPVFRAWVAVVALAASSVNAAIRMYITVFFSSHSVLLHGLVLPLLCPGFILFVVVAVLALDFIFYLLVASILDLIY